MRETGKEANQLIDNAPEQLRLCFKLALLEREWAGLVDGEFAARSCLESCRLEEDAAVITVCAKDAACAAAMNFIKARLQRTISGYLAIPVSRVEIKVGKITRLSNVKQPLPAWQRRAPLVIGEEDARRELEFTSAFVEDEELASALARLKALAGKKSRR